MKEGKFQLLLHFFALFLVLRSIAASYYATKYAMMNKFDYISSAAETFRNASVIVLFVMIVLSLPVFFKVNKKTEKLFDILSILILLFGFVLVFV